MRTSDNQYEHGILYKGYDYKNQAWVRDGKYIRCGHPGVCSCYGKAHEGEKCEVSEVDYEQL